MLSEPLKDIIENEHAQAVLVCEIDGLPPPTFKWYVFVLYVLFSAYVSIMI